MLPAVLGAENRGYRVLLQHAPRGTPSSILTLRLCRYFHGHKPNICRPTSHIQTKNPITGLRYATTHGPPSLLSQDAVAYVQSLLTRPGAITSHNPRSLNQSHSSNTAGSESIAPCDYKNDSRVELLQRALSSLREGDTRSLVVRLNVIEKMTQEELQGVVAAIPRTTFTEIFRALDPLRVLRDCDAADQFNVPFGMHRQLFMESTIDDWGVRRLYIRVMQRLLILMAALKTAGYTLHMEEYIVLIRCAGACCDASGAGAIWNDICRGPALVWRNSEVYTEYIKARFLTEPLYSNFQKTTRMVTPRNLHRSRFRLLPASVQRLDGLRLLYRAKRGSFGLNKDVEHVEELMRALRGHGPAVKLFITVTQRHSFRLDEDLICTAMISLARAGLMRMVGTHILQEYFGIRTPHPFPLEPGDDQPFRQLRLSSEPPRIQPTVRLMRTIVESYGSNAEIGVAVQLIEYLHNTHHIPIPRDVWEDLLEWTYIMSTPPASTAWVIARLYVKVPSPQAVEMIWNAMTSDPYNQEPSFKSYDLLIRCLIGRCSDDLTPVLSRMREAIAMYDKQCQVYEGVALEYIQHLRHPRDKISTSAMTQRFERARFKKQHMWYTIMTWCRMILKRMPFSKVSPVPNPLIPAFIREFRPFLRNPVEYLTPTGRVQLSDPLIETFRVIPIGAIQQVVPMKDMQENWVRKRISTPRVIVVSSHSLARFRSSKMRDPLQILEPEMDAFVHLSTHSPSRKSPSHKPAFRSFPL
ncbi:mitochondrial ATPase expression-domain-containing protein [Nemania diffusa]|nr:mitochondrial ATPase expression-domain-containing protein [Nemania diffusa]